MYYWFRTELDSTEPIRLLVDDQVVQGAASINKKIADLDVNPPKEAVILGNAEVSHKDIYDPAGYAMLWAFHGFAHVCEFVELIPAMEDGGEYCFRFLLNEERYTQDIAFPMFMLGTMVLKKGAVKVMMGCTIERSSDHTNHFFLMQKK